jgi:hypothetical protein
MPLSNLVTDQVKFLQDKALLILYAKVNGIHLTETEGCILLLRKARDGTKYVDGVHMRQSLHYERCATDFMIYNEDGRPVFSGSDPRWEKLGNYWESLDDRNAWGGRFGDSNHFSRTRGGRK